MTADICLLSSARSYLNRINRIVSNRHIIDIYRIGIIRIIRIRIVVCTEYDSMISCCQRQSCSSPAIAYPYTVDIVCCSVDTDCQSMINIALWLVVEWDRSVWWHSDITECCRSCASKHIKSNDFFVGIIDYTIVTVVLPYFDRIITAERCTIV